MYDKKQIKKSARICSSVDFAGYYPAGAHVWIFAIKKKRKEQKNNEKIKGYYSFSSPYSNHLRV